MSEPASEKLVSADVIAEHLGVTERWVRDAARRGQIPSIRLGGQMRSRRKFRLSEVLAAVEEGRQAAAAG